MTEDLIVDFCENPCATRRALYLLMDPSAALHILRTHLLLTAPLEAQPSPRHHYHEGTLLPFSLQSSSVACLDYQELDRRSLVR